MFGFLSDFRQSKLDVKIIVVSLSERLKKVRTELKKSQKAMASDIGIATRTWQVYEEGGSVPGGNVLRDIACIGFDINWLLTGKGQMCKEYQGQQAAAPHDSEAPALNSELSLTMGESFELLANIYSSGNNMLVRAINVNLLAFNEAVGNKALALKTVGMMEEMNQRMLAQENELAAIKDELVRMKSGGVGSGVGTACSG